MFVNTKKIRNTSQMSEKHTYLLSSHHPHMKLDGKPTKREWSRTTAHNIISYYILSNLVATMKFSLVSFLAAASSFAVSSAFVVQSPAVGRTSVVLEGSRNAQKKASRAKWMEARGFGEGANGATITAETGLMTNSDGLEYIKLVHPDTGASSEIYLFGGDVTSYKDADGTEFIAVRPDAKMDGSKPISGGLSHCFPQVKIRWSSYLFLLSTFDRLTVSFLPFSLFSLDPARFSNTDLPATSTGP
jgi:hypothetical protein